MLWLSAGSLHAQKNIYGQLRDSSGNAVPFFALALLHAADSSLAKGTMTTDSGTFVFEHVPAGSYRLRSEGLGFAAALTETFTVDSLQDYRHPTIHLHAAPVSLGQVTVAAFRPMVEFRQGMVVLNVENNILASGNTVLDLLKHIPGVIVDAQNNITVNGKAGVRFMMDGRLQQLPAAQMMTLLGSMPAESVSGIELIKNPPARYDASGTAGLINIVTKKVKVKGFNGNVAQIVSQGKQFRSTSSLSLNYKANRLGLFSNVSYLNSRLEDRYWMIRRLDNQGQQTLLDQDGRLLTDKSALSVNLGAEYELSPKTTIGLYVNAGPNHGTFNSTASTHIDDGLQAFSYSLLKYQTDTKEDINSPSVALNATHRFDSAGTQLVFSADYTNFLNTQNTLSENRFYAGGDQEVMPLSSFRSRIGRDFRILTQRLDLTKPFGKTLSLEAGLKASFADNGSDVKLALTDPSTGSLTDAPAFSYRYDYHERILAGYASVSRAWKKWNVQAGLRAEHTGVNALNQATAVGFTRSYLNVFPNLAFDFAPSEKHSIQSTYSYRIDRPDYNQLNPMRVINEQLSYTTGNPQLRPQYSHNANLDYSYRHFITAGLSYSHVHNFMYYYAYTSEASKVNIDTVVNFRSRNIYTFNLLVQKQLAGWYQLQVNGMAAYGDFKGRIEDVDAGSRSYRFLAMCRNEFYLPRDFKAVLQVSYNSPFRDAIQRYAASWSCNIVLQKSLMAKRLNIGLAVYDLFYSEVSALSNTLPGQYYYFKVRNDSRRVRISLSYKFGNMRFGQNQRRSNEEEQQRLKNQPNQK